MNQLKEKPDMRPMKPSSVKPNNVHMFYCTGERCAFLREPRAASALMPVRPR